MILARWQLLFIVLLGAPRAVAPCPLLKPCNCDPRRGFWAFNRTCGNLPNAAAACWAALARTGVNMTRLEHTQTHADVTQSCHQRDRTSCIPIVVTGTAQLPFCTGRLHQKRDGIFGSQRAFIVFTVLLTFALAIVGCGIMCWCIVRMEDTILAMTEQDRVPHNV